MSKVVGVFNAPPVYALGLAGALSNVGFELEEIADPVKWQRHHRKATLLVGVHERADLDVVIELKEEDPNSIVVTLVDDVDLDAIEASLSAGATGSVALNAPATDVLLTLSAAMADSAVIPVRVARSMAERGSRARLPVAVTDDERCWLRALGTGETVTDLSARLGFSEREMYRRLRRLYSMMGATGRTDALLKAARWGLLE